MDMSRLSIGHIEFEVYMFSDISSHQTPPMDEVRGRHNAGTMPSIFTGEKMWKS